VELARRLVSKEAFAKYASSWIATPATSPACCKPVRLIRSSTYSMRDVISGYGEIWSTRCLHHFLRERRRIKGEVTWIDAPRVVIVEWGSLGPAVSMVGERGESSATGAPAFARPG